MEFLQIVLLTVVSFIVLFVMTKIMGFRAISELSFLDYVVGITIGSVAAEMSTNIDIEWWKGVTAMAIYALFAVLSAYLSQKSARARRFLSGEPIIIINNGNIDKKAMKKAKIEINDLLTSARTQGYFDLADIDYAIMETTGKISFMPTPAQRQLNPKDFNFNPQRKGLCFNIVLDGNIMKNNLAAADINEAKVNSILAQRGVALNQILLATIDESGAVQIFEK